MKGLKLMSKSVIHLKRRKNRGWRVLIGHPQDQGKNNLNLRMSFFQPGRIMQEDFQGRLFISLVIFILI